MGIFDKLFGKKQNKQGITSPPTPSTTPQGDTKELMDEGQFWKIIEASKKSSNGNYEKQQLDLTDGLQQLEVMDIVKFDNQFRKLRGDAYTWDLWGAAYIMNGGCSDDCFSDFRGWLIGLGKNTYYAAMSDPESLVDTSHEMDDEWEGLSYSAMTAYEQKTGIQMPNGYQENYEITGEPWEEDEAVFESRYPRVWKKWGDV